MDQLKKISSRAGRSSTTGQALIEVLVALGILTLGFFGIFALLTNSIGLDRVVSDTYRATYLAAEGIEIVKNLIDFNIIQGRCIDTDFFNNPNQRFAFYTVDYLDRDFTTFPSRGLGRPLNFDPVNHVYLYQGGLPQSPFRRAVGVFRIYDELTGSSVVALRVQSLVTWRKRGGVQGHVELEDFFYNWRPNARAIQTGC